MDYYSYSNKGYIKLLIRYLFYDLKTLIYVIFMLTAVFYSISNLLNKEINKNLIQYGGLHESMTTYSVELSDSASSNELNIVLDIFNKYKIIDIKEIWLKFSPLSKVGVEFSTENPIPDTSIVGRGFSREELLDGKKVIILNKEDYQGYYKNFMIGDEILLGGQKFRLIGISYEADQSVVPVKCLLGIDMEGSFRINNLILKTEKSLKSKDISNIKKNYYIKNSDSSIKDCFKVRSLFGNVLEDIFNNLIDYIFSIILILAFSLFLLIQTCSILFYKNESHQFAYIVSGSEKNHLKHIIYGEVIASIMISLMFSYLIMLGEKLWIN